MAADFMYHGTTVIGLLQHAGLSVAIISISFAMLYFSSTELTQFCQNPF
jgi:hypothetical protein